MIEFTIGKKTYKIPELTIREYYKIQHFLEEGTIASKDMEQQFNIISTLSECPVDELKTLTTYEWSLTWTTFVRVIETYFSQDIGGIIDEFEHKGTNYGLIKLDQITVGEFADLDIIVNADDSQKRLHEVLAILYRPIKKRGLFRTVITPYKDIDFVENSELFKDLPLKFVKSSLSFFLLLGNQSLTNMLDSLTQQVKKTKHLPDPVRAELLAQVRLLLKDGGIFSIYSHTKTLQIMTGLQNSLYTQDLIGFRGNMQKLKKQIRRKITLN